MGAPDALQELADFAEESQRAAYALADAHRVGDFTAIDVAERRVLKSLMPKVQIEMDAMVEMLRLSPESSAPTMAVGSGSGGTVDRERGLRTAAAWLIEYAAAEDRVPTTISKSVSLICRNLARRLHERTSPLATAVAQREQALLDAVRTVKGLHHIKRLAPVLTARMQLDVAETALRYAEKRSVLLRLSEKT